MNHLTRTLTHTLRTQRAALSIEPIHAKYAPVMGYSEHIAAIKGEPFVVINIPRDSTAYQMGYRFVSIPRTELDYYLSHGATMATGEAT